MCRDALEGRGTSSPSSLARRLLALAGTTWLQVIVLISTALAVHLPSLTGELIWDDNYLLGENPFFRSPLLALETFRHHLFLDSFSGHYRPVQNLSYMLDYLFWNGNVYGYHLSNSLWHALAGVLLFFLLRRLVGPRAATGKPLEAGAFFVALLWVLHPVHSAAVDYVSGRADSLAFAFCAGAWLLYLRGRSCRGALVRSFAWCGAFVLGLLGLCSREIAVVWIVLFLFYLFFFDLRQSRLHRLGAVIACIVVLTTYAGLRRLPDPRLVQTNAATWDATTRAGLMLRALGDYARVTWWPARLHMERSVTTARMFRPQPTWQDRFSFGPLTVLGLLTGACLLASGLIRGPGHKLRLFGTIWFVAGYLPISNIVNLNATAAEHWLYLPLVGLLLVIFGWVVELPRRLHVLAGGLACCAAVALGARSFVRSSDWSTAQVFYERTIAAAGWSPRVSLNLAIIYARQERFPEARQLLERTLAAWPGYPLARSHLAIVLSKMGEVERGRELLAETAAQAADQRTEYPRTWVAILQMARAAVQRGDDLAALRILEEGRQLEPDKWALAELQGEILRRTEGAEAALPIVEAFTSRYWWQYSAFLALGKLKAQQGDGPSALAALTHASRLDVHETSALNLIARIQMRAKNLPAALGAQRRAVSRQPDEPSQYILFSEVLLEMGQMEQAQEAREKARQLEEEGRLAAAQA